MDGFAIKRVYEAAAPDDGTRVLVDRLWPRGMTKAEARVDLWLKEVAPSSQLRKWFGHEPSRWISFRQRYHAELEANPEPVQRLRQLAGKGRVTLLYSAHDEAHNQARALLDYLEPPETGHGRTDD
jgi:uncharacterized protein YeaO (DUF488 family)